MTELRESVRAILSGHATDCALPWSSLEARRKSRDKAIDAIMALIDRPAPVAELESQLAAPRPNIVEATR